MSSVWWLSFFFFLQVVTKGAPRTLPLSSKNNNPSRNSVAVETKDNTITSEHLRVSNTGVDFVVTASEGVVTSEKLPVVTNGALGSPVTIATEGSTTGQISVSTVENTIITGQVPVSTSPSPGTVAVETMTVELPVSASLTTGSKINTSVQLSINLHSIAITTEDKAKTSNQLSTSTTDIAGSVTMTTTGDAETSTTAQSGSISTTMEEGDLSMRLNFNLPEGEVDFNDIFLPPRGNEKVFDSPEFMPACPEGFVRIRNVCRQVVQT